MHGRTIIPYERGVLAIAIAAMLCGGAPAWGHERLQQTLTSPSDNRALGRARLRMKSDSDGRLVLAVRGLAADQTYEVIVGSVKVGTLSTSGGGNGAVRFRTRPRGRDLILGFDPHGALITLRGADGSDVLLGTLPAASPSAEGAVACCLPDDGGEECEARTADDCASRGGTAVAAASCLPNPCAGVPPVATDIVCCEPDDSGTECEDRTAAECAAHGGTVIAATSCSPNPCQPQPPADPDIVCCVPDDGGAECEDRTAVQCAAQGGTNMGAGTCSPDACGASLPQATPVADDHGGHHRGRGGDGGADNHGGSTTYYGVPTTGVAS